MRGGGLGRRIAPPRFLLFLALFAAGLAAGASVGRYGWLAVVVARFVPWARTFVPIAAGVAGMSPARFGSATVAGAAIWGAGLIVLGYYAAEVPWLKTLAYAVAGVAIAGSVLVPLGGWLLRRRAPRKLADG